MEMWQIALTLELLVMCDTKCFFIRASFSGVCDELFIHRRGALGEIWTLDLRKWEKHLPPCPESPKKSNCKAQRHIGILQISGLAPIFSFS